MKIVMSGLRPLDDTVDFRVIRALAGSMEWLASSRIGHLVDKSFEARAKYVNLFIALLMRKLCDHRQ